MIWIKYLSQRRRNALIYRILLPFSFQEKGLGDEFFKIISKYYVSYQ
jgi:hypothetical protein